LIEQSSLGHRRPLQPSVGRVYTIVLNWNGWHDTIECLESVFRIDYLDDLAVVCDNASSDGSLDQIRRRAQGEVEVDTKNSALAPLANPPVQKPIPFAAVDLPTTENGGIAGARVLLVPTKANLGFAGRNNVGLRYALNRGDCDFAWLLDNDTVVRLAERAKGQFPLAYCPRSIVYHREGGMIDSHRAASPRSALSEFYASRKRVLFTRRHHPVALPTVLAAVGLSAVRRSLSLRGRNLQAVIRGALQGLSS
jgi:hypothetical protein